MNNEKLAKLNNIAKKIKELEGMLENINNIRENIKNSLYHPKISINGYEAQILDTTGLIVVALEKEMLVEKLEKLTKEFESL